MRPKALPREVLARWLDLEERCDAHAQALVAAESEVGRLRSVLSSGNHAVTPEEFAAARDGFDSVHQDMLRLRVTASSHARLKAAVKRFIEELPSTTELSLVQPPDGADLDAVRSELKGLREQLRQLQAFPPAAPDIAARVRGYVTTLANQALPMVRG